MDILDSIMNAGNGAAVRQLGSQLGLDEAQTASALSALVPALSAGLRQNLQSPEDERAWALRVRPQVRRRRDEHRIGPEVQSSR